MKEILNNYQQLIDKYSNEVNRLDTNIKSVSFARLSTFIVLLIFFYEALTNESIIHWFLIGICLVLFLILVKKHGKLFHTKTFIENLLKINKDELKSINGDFSAYSSGKEYEISGHEFSLDLDVFGDNSIYQMIDRTTTQKGSQLLGKWLNNPSLDTNEIKQRQDAIKELREEITFRQYIRARGMGVKENASEILFLEKWHNTENFFFPKKSFKILSFLIPLVNISAILLFSLGYISGNILVILLLLSLGFIGLYQKKINKIHQNLSKRTHFLEKYIHILKLIENKEFNTTFLNRVKSKITINNTTASHNITELSSILSAFDTRLNIFAGIILNAIFIWDIHQVWRVEKWKTKHANKLEQWFEAIAEIEAIISISNLSYNNPQWIFPQVNNDNKWEFKDIKHPLMRTEECIANDFIVEKSPHLKVITGANMAGKSTYLRTVGSNLVLAMIGAPVHAKFMTFTAIQVITSLRTTDSLLKNESYFYAEIKRLQFIVNRLLKGEHLFVLLDEILKGTNSKDKEEGSKALLKRLINLNTVGIIATHDLSLGKLADEFSTNIENQCFEVDIKNDELSFDYKIRPGIAQNMNASFLLKKMNIV